MDVRDGLKRLIDEIMSDDPRTALIALRRLKDDELPWIEQKVVASARCAGWNWATIGRLLQRSRASVRQRFSDQRLAIRPSNRSDGQQFEHAFRSAMTEIERRRRYEADDNPVAW